MLECGILLSCPIENMNIQGHKVYKAKNLIACFEQKLDMNTIIEIAKMQPTYFVMRDSSMENDSMASDFE